MQRLIDIPATLSEAKRHHLAGCFPLAEEAYRHILNADPALGDVWYYLGRACISQGKTEEALACYQKAVALRPNFVEAYSNLGIALKTLGKLDDAIACYREAIRLRPEYLEAHLNLGNALESQGDSSAAMASYRFVIHQRPQFAQAHHNLGLALKNQRQWNEALVSLSQAVRLEPLFAEAHSNLASVLAELRREDEALASFQRALDLNPKLIIALCGRVNLAVRREDFDAAQAMLEDAIQLQPNSADLHASLGFVLAEQGLLALAFEHYRQALELNPASASTWSNYLYHRNYDPECDSATLMREHHQGATKLDGSRRVHPPASLERAGGRPLRVGYVSPDFRLHAVATFIEPILAHHDPNRVQTFCYSDVSTPDATTARLRSQAQAWRDIRPLTDDTVEQLIRRDQIDILIDLAGHTARNRLNVFARKPAPLQVTYLGYPGTTGLTSIDGLITDEIIDPIEIPSGLVEAPVRLQGSFCCYAPPADAPEVAPLPMQRVGFPTFGSLHKLPKLNDQVLALWSRLLLAVPSARLLLVRDRLKGQRGQQILDQFEANGVARGRVEVQHDWNMMKHWTVYASIDLSLDVFPWSGHTTACESLWMGVPIVTLAGERRASRMTASVLNAIGLSELIAETSDQYIQIAASRVSDPDRLAQTRATLRERMQRSPLCDGPSFTRGLESAYEALWSNRRLAVS